MLLLAPALLFQDGGINMEQSLSQTKLNGFVIIILEIQVQRQYASVSVGFFNLSTCPTYCQLNI